MSQIVYFSIPKYLTLRNVKRKVLIYALLPVLWTVNLLYGQEVLWMQSLEPPDLCWTVTVWVVVRY